MNWIILFLRKQKDIFEKKLNQNPLTRLETDDKHILHWNVHGKIDRIKPKLLTLSQCLQKNQPKRIASTWLKCVHYSYWLAPEIGMSHCLDLRREEILGIKLKFKKKVGKLVQYLARCILKLLKIDRIFCWNIKNQILSGSIQT